MRIAPEDGDLIVSRATPKLSEQLSEIIELHTHEELSDREFDALSTALQDDGIVAAVGTLVRIAG